MAHEISDITGVHEMFYVNDEMPWHGLGTPVEDALTSEEAIQAAHLEWEVEKRKVYFKKDDGTFIETKAYSTVRTDVEFPLGIVSERYMTIQNREAFCVHGHPCRYKSGEVHYSRSPVQRRKDMDALQDPGDPCY